MPVQAGSAKPGNAAGGFFQHSPKGRLHGWTTTQSSPKGILEGQLALTTPFFDRDGQERPLQKPDLMVSVTVTVEIRQQ